MKHHRLALLGSVVLILVATVIWVAGGPGGGEHRPRPGPAGSRSRDPERSILALEGAETAAGDVRVTLRALDSAGPVVTIISQLEYDSARLKMTRCGLNPDIGTGSTTAKVLHVAEPVPGLVRAVVAGTLQALPQAADVLACDFAVRPHAPAGPTTVRAHGDVADNSFADRSFSAEKTIVIEN